MPENNDVKKKEPTNENEQGRGEEQNEENGATHTDREVELEQKVAALEKDLEKVKAENRRMYIRLTGGAEQSEDQPDPMMELFKQYK